MMSVAMSRTPLKRPVRVRELLVAAVPGLRDRLVEFTIRQEWADIAGRDLARRSRPGELRAGTLAVTVDTSPCLHEMTLRSGELLGGIQARHGRAITALRFALGTIPAAAPAAVSRRPRSETLNADDTSSVDALASPITDPALATSVRRVLTKDFLARRRRAASSARRQHT
jgi:hypothetical protein